MLESMLSSGFYKLMRLNLPSISICHLHYAGNPVPYGANSKTTMHKDQMGQGSCKLLRLTCDSRSVLCPLQEVLCPIAPTVQPPC